MVYFTPEKNLLRNCEARKSGEKLISERFQLLRVIIGWSRTEVESESRENLAGDEWLIRTHLCVWFTVWWMCSNLRHKFTVRFSCHVPNTGMLCTIKWHLNWNLPTHKFKLFDVVTLSPCAAAAAVLVWRDFLPNLEKGLEPCLPTAATQHN